MNENTFEMSMKNFNVAMQKLESNLKALKISSAEILKSSCLLEEIFLSFRKFNNNEEKFSVTVSIKNFLGEVNIVVECKGESFNPILRGNISEDDEDYYNHKIL